MLYVKYGENRLHGFTAVVVWKYWQRMNDDDRQTKDACQYYKLTYEPLTQVS